MAKDFTKLGQILGYKFTGPEHLRLALRHSSLSVGGPEGSNERYEFLGDRVLGLVIAEMLLQRFPNETEGDIAKRHTALVRQEALVQVAETLGLGDFIEMSDGEGASGGRQNPSVLSDCCEAVLAALYLDGGLGVASDFINRHWSPLIDETAEPPKDAKTTLQEWAQARGLGLPEYQEVSRAGPPHKPIFVIAARVEGRSAAEASGSSKRKAEQEAAEKLLEELKNE